VRRSQQNKIAALPCHHIQRKTHAQKPSSLTGLSYLLDVVVAQGTAILKLLAGEDQALLVRGDTLLVLDLGLDVVDGVARLDVEGNGLTRQGLDETMVRYLSATYPNSTFQQVHSSRCRVDESILGCVAALRDRRRRADSRKIRETYICTVNSQKEGPC
jgi:hypothetical protein